MADVRKAIEMFRQVRTPIVGVVENMSYFLCPHCNERTEIFSYGEGKNTADHFEIPFLGEIPLNATVRQQCDNGNPPALQGEEGAEAAPFFSVARQVEAGLEKLAAEETEPVIQID
jgi:ATP-binding protein involved in chromosome partitioning